MRRKRLFWHLYPSHMILAGLLVLSFLIFIPVTTKNFYFEEKIKLLNQKGEILNSLMQKEYGPGNIDSLGQICTRYGNLLQIRITLVEKSGTVLCDSAYDKSKMDNHGKRPEVLSAFSGSVGEATRISKTLDDEYLYLAFPFPEQMNPLLALRVSLSVSSLREVLSRIYWQFLVGAIVLILMAGIFSYWPSHKISVPLENLKLFAENLASSNFEGSVYVRPDDPLEIKDLSSSMYEMGKQLRERIDTIEKQRNEQNAVFSSMKEGLLTTDNEGKVFHFNSQFIKYFGLNEEEIYKGRPVNEIVKDPEFLKIMQDILNNVETAVGLESEGLELELNLENGRILDTRGAQLIFSNGEMMGAVFIFNNVTKIRQLENHRKQFVGNVSHELRTPLTSMQGYLETLIEGKVEDRDTQVKFLDTVQRQTVRLNGLIDDLLVLSQIEKETDDDRVVLVQKDLRPIIDSVVFLCEGKRAKKNITLEVDCPEGIKIMMKPNLLEQALLNLVDNAIKYGSEETTVKIQVEEIDDEVSINVHDRGGGIPEKHLSRLFERFYSVDKARSRELGGTGLGLAIVKHITLAHNGRVNVTSVEGQGSTFSIILPRNKSGA